MTSRRSWVAVSMTVMAVVLAGCGNATPDPTISVPSISPTTVISPSLVPSESVSSPGESGPGQSLGHEYVYILESGDAGGDLWTVNADGTYGSGCTPPSGDTLPDGVWFVIVSDWGADTLTFDLMCQYSWDSEAARDQLAACEAERGTDAGCGDSVIWTSNDNSRLRTLPVADSATFIDPYTSTEMPLGEALLGDSFPFTMEMWLFVNGGEITQVLEQFYS